MLMSCIDLYHIHLIIITTTTTTATTLIVTDTTDTDITTAAEEIQLLLQFMRDKSTKKLHSEKYREKAASKLAAQAAAGSTGSGVTDPKRAAAAVQRGKDKDSMPPSLLQMGDEG